MSFSIQEFFGLEIGLHSEDNRRIKTYKLTSLKLEICVHKYDYFLCCDFTIKTWYKYKPYQTLKLFCISFISYILCTEIIKKDFSMKQNIFIQKLEHVDRSLVGFVKLHIVNLAFFYISAFLYEDNVPLMISNPECSRVHSWLQFFTPPVFTPFAVWFFRPSQKSGRIWFPDSSPSCILLWLTE